MICQVTVKRGLSIVALAIALSGVASADPVEPRTSRVVRFADLNLNSREGAEALYRRIASAASSMCGVSAGMRTLGVSAIMAARVRQCEDDAILRAVRQINAPMLTSVLKKRIASTT